MRKNVVVTGLFGVLVALTASPVRAGFIIQATYDSSLSAAAQTEIGSAVAYYNSMLTAVNSDTVEIYFTSMSSGLGQSNSTVYQVSYQSFINQLTNASSGDTTDTTALAHLPNGSTNPVDGGTAIDIKSADARALGFNAPGLFSSNGSFNTGGSYDGIISINTGSTDNGSGTVTAGEYSLVAVAEHEIDEVLGLGSNVGGTGFFATPAVEDLFRYDSSGNRNYTTSGDNAYFSLNGTNRLVQFNQDGVGDYGDWHTSSTVRVQDAYGTPGRTPTLANDGGAELVALDAIGYNLSSQSPVVPEPSSLSLFGIGLAGITIFGARRRTRAAA